MAALSKDAGGTKRIMFYPDGCPGKRKTIRLGRVSLKAANSFKLKVEELVNAKNMRTPIDSETARWLGELSNTMHAKLAEVELVEPRERVDTTLAGLLSIYFKNIDVKPQTEVTYRQTERSLLDYFGPSREIGAITQLDGERWKKVMLDSGLAHATVSKRVKTARALFAKGVKWKMLDDNPLADVKAGPQTNTSRQRFIPQETVARVIDAAPSAQWRLLITLSRYGGLRVPSEASRLTWGDVDWQRLRLHITSPKTEDQGKGSRMVPIFPEIMGPLRDAYELASEGEVFVLGDLHLLTNPNPQLHRIIKRAGLDAWPRIWHNMRASRQTELAAEYPLHTVCSWLGNTATIAAGHYLQVTDADFIRAVGDNSGEPNGAEYGAVAAQNASRHRAAPKITQAHGSQKSLENTGVMRFSDARRPSVQSQKVTPTGFEPVSSP